MHRRRKFAYVAGSLGGLSGTPGCVEAQSGEPSTGPAMDHKQAEIASRTPEFMAAEASKPFGWDAAHFVEWATVTEILHRLGVQRGASAIDVGCGSGWTTLFLAEAGLDALGYDLVPENIELARERARRWGSGARFEIAD